MMMMIIIIVSDNDNITQRTVKKSFNHNLETWNKTALKVTTTCSIYAANLNFKAVVDLYGNLIPLTEKVMCE
jgi:hypothetical protein